MEFTMTYRYNWNLFDTCQRCGAAPGQRCHNLVQRRSGMMAAYKATPHNWRDRVDERKPKKVGYQRAFLLTDTEDVLS